MVSSETQFRKARSPIFDSDLGMSIERSNTPIRDFGKVIDVSDVHDERAELPISIRDPGKIIDSSEVHPKKTRASNCITPSGMLMVSNDLH